MASALSDRTSKRFFHIHITFCSHNWLRVLGFVLYRQKFCPLFSVFLHVQQHSEHNSLQTCQNKHTGLHENYTMGTTHKVKVQSHTIRKLLYGLVLNATIGLMSLQLKTLCHCSSKWWTTVVIPYKLPISLFHEPLIPERCIISGFVFMSKHFHFIATIRDENFLT
jgi:hypothetical protein